MPPPTIAAAIAVFVIALSVRSTARDLRPSDHGLEYQPNAPPPGKKYSPPEMRSFFGPSPPDGRNEGLPKAVNSSEPLWLNARRRGGGDRVRKVLVVASVASGVAGVGLLLVSAFIYFFTFRKQNSSSSSSRTNDSDDHNNTKEVVA